MQNEQYRLLSPETIARLYEAKFHVPLAVRLDDLIAKYPAIVAPSFLSWEGEIYTGASNTAELISYRARLGAPAPRVTCEHCNARNVPADGICGWCGAVTPTAEAR